MRSVRELSREELEELASAVQQALFLDYDRAADNFHWNPDKQWSGADVAMELLGKLTDLSLAPNEPMPFVPPA